MEETIFKDQYLMIYMQDLPSLFFWEDKKTNAPGTFMIRKSISTIEQII